MKYYKCLNCCMESGRFSSELSITCPRCGCDMKEIVPMSIIDIENIIDKVRTDVLFDDGWDLIGDVGQTHMFKVLSYLELAKLECRLARLSCERSEKK